MHYFRVLILSALGYFFTLAFVFSVAYLIEVDFSEKSHWEWGNLMYASIVLGTPIILGILAHFYFQNEEIEPTRKNGVIFGSLFFLISGILDVFFVFFSGISNPCSGNGLIYFGQLFFWLNITFTLLATTVSARLKEMN